MTLYVKLFVKSANQYKRTIENLDALGLRGFLLVGYKDIADYGITVFIKDASAKYTDGRNGTAESYQPEHVYTKRKEFIAEVKRVLGESK